MDRRILILMAVLLLGSASLFGYRKLIHKPQELDYEIVPNGVVKTGDTIYYKGKLSNASRWKWDFGDDEINLDPSGMHVYEKPGEYEMRVTAYGAGCVQQKTVVVNVVDREIIPSSPAAVKAEPVIVTQPEPKMEARTSAKPSSIRPVRIGPRPRPEGNVPISEDPNDELDGLRRDKEAHKQK